MQTSRRLSKHSTRAEPSDFWESPGAVPLPPPQSKALASLVSVEKYKMVPRTCNTEY